MKIIRHICKEYNPHIISTHDAFLFEISIPLQAAAESETRQVVPHTVIDNKRLDWENCEVEQYQDTLQQILENNFQTFSSFENLHILARMIPQAFIQAADEAVPCKKQKKANFKVKKSPEWLKAEIKAKKINRKWIKAGKPYSSENDIFNEKKQARAELRKSVKTHYANEAIEENNLLMKSNFRDPKLF